MDREFSNFSAKSWKACGNKSNIVRGAVIKCAGSVCLVWEKWAASLVLYLFFFVCVYSKRVVLCPFMNYKLNHFHMHHFTRFEVQRRSLGGAAWRWRWPAACASCQRCIDETVIHQFFIYRKYIET